MSKPTLLMVALCLASPACSDDDYVRLYQTSAYAPSLTDEGIQKLDHLGGTLIDSGANFGVYSENATRIELLLFDDPEEKLPTRRIPMSRFGNVWNIYVQGVGLGQYYGYVAWGPNWTYDADWYPGSIHGFKADVDTNGHRFNPNKLLFDPYSKALHRDHDWSKGSLASGPARAELTWSASAKSVIVESQYVWSETEETWRNNRMRADYSGHGWNEMIIYETHAKGFTASAASAVDHPGTYRGIGEKADYLADLGITALELLPVHEKPLDGTYWGYLNISYFSPELAYSAKRERNEVIDEFKWMVDQLHQRGIEVIIDVVYNHTGEGGLWREKIDDVTLDASADLLNFDPKEVASIYSYRGLDNAAYYALSEDKQTYWNNTGVGNECRANHTPMRRLILDSLRYWANEMHVDGFRFDLAPVLGTKDGDPNTWDDPKNTVLQDIIDDPALRKYNTRIISEPWSLAHFKLGEFPTSSESAAVAWYEWNGHFRDVWRSFINSDEFLLNGNEGSVDVGGSLTGSASVFQEEGRKPYHSINFITAHDGFTLYDLFTYAEKRNGCSPLNPVCCDSPNSPFCARNDGESNNRSRDWGADNEHLKRQMMRNAFAAMLLAHGTPMLLGGDEWMRTQLGNNNAYSTGADNPYNWYDWGAWQPNAERKRMHDFVRKLIKLRKDHNYALAPADYAKGAPFAWKTAGNSDPVDADWSKKSLMLHYYDKTAGPELLVLFNMENATVDFTLPTGTPWRRLLDTQSYFDTDAYFTKESASTDVSANITLDNLEVVSGATYSAISRSIVVLEGGVP